MSDFTYELHDDGEHWRHHPQVDEDDSKSHDVDSFRLAAGTRQVEPKAASTRGSGEADPECRATKYTRISAPASDIPMRISQLYSWPYAIA